MKLVLFSIVSHGQEKLVRKLIKSIDKFMSINRYTLKIVITENLENDIDVSSEYYSIEKVVNSRKKGFGENHNSAFELFKSDYFFVINPDIEFIHSFELDNLVTDLEKMRTDIGSPLIFNRSGNLEDYKRSDLTIINLLKRKIFKTKEKFDWFAGVFLVFKSSTFEELKGFDTKFFMYVEDCDLCMRARKLGKNLNDLISLRVLHNAQRASSYNINHLKWHISSLVKYWLN